MGIKLKSTKETEKQEEREYEEMVKDHKKIKIARTIVMLILAIMIAISILGAKDIKANYNVLNNNNLYNYNFLGKDIDEFTKKVVEFAELYKNEEYIKDANNITQGELDIANEAVKNILSEEYRRACDKIHDDYDTSKWSEYTLRDEQDKIYKELLKKYGYDEENLKKLIVEKKLEIYNKYNNSLNNQHNLKYIVYDKSNNFWLSNYDMDKDQITELKNDSSYFAEYHISNGTDNKAIYINGKRVADKELNHYDSYGYYGGHNSISTVEVRIQEENSYTYHESIPVKSDLDIYIAVPKKLVAGDNLYNSYENYIRANYVTNNQIAGLVCGIIGILITLFILKKIKYKGSYFNNIVDKFVEIPIDFGILALILIYFSKSVFFYHNWSESFRNTMYFRNIMLWTIALLATYAFIKAAYIKHKSGNLFLNSYIIKFYDNFRVAMEKKSLGKKLAIILLIYILICAISFFGFLLAFEEVGAIAALGIILVATCVVVFIVVRDFAYLNKITNGTRDMCAGKNSNDIPEKGKGPLRDLAHNINNMKEGLKVSLENETKSEKMKTELITNVSHDLKTPLTSIINYVDLLKRIDVQPEEAKTYVSILDKKSQRLKILIEDLFEASKAASGAMQLSLEKLDVVALLRQTLGEAEGRIEKANLNFKVTMPKEKIFIEADGRKLWRVFENLINNSVKYSLQGTRVYVDIKKKNDFVEISMKNISAHELNFDPIEITERFKRGEESRHTEGSGLGLAIAKSIVELHGGKFEIDVEADLFKVNVTLPTINE